MVVTRDVNPNGQSPLLPIPPSLNVETFPSILGLIIDYSTSSTRVNLLRCSKSMFQAVAPSLYRNLQLISPQFSIVIDTGLAFPHTQPSNTLSPYLQHCLHQVYTLHTSYFDTFQTDFDNLPDGCLPNLKTVVLHVDRVNFNFNLTLPRSFESMGTADGWDLYVTISEAVMSCFSELNTQRIRILLDEIPRSCRSITLIIGRAPRLGAMPLLRFWEKRGKGFAIPLSVVLLPWEREEEQVEHETRALQSWLEVKEPDFDLDQKRRFVGMEYNGFWGDQENLVGCGPQEELMGKTHSVMSFEPFLRWLGDLKPDTVFSEREARQLELNSARLVLSAQEYLARQFERHLEVISLDDPRSSVMFEAKRQNLEHREEALSVLEAIMARQA